TINNRGTLNTGSDLENRAFGTINNICPGVIIGTIVAQGGTVVNQCTQSTTTAVSSSQNPSTFGQSVTFTATMSPVPDGGSVQFQANGTNLGSPVTVSGGTASASTSSLAIGYYTITASYSGTTNFVSSTGTLSQTVNPLICPAGSFLSSNSCIPAPPGSYVPLPGATSATLCPAGTFTSLAGQTQCTPAPAGSYIPSSGATSSLQCTTGSFQPNPGSISCNPSDPGNYVSGIGSISEIQCSAGSFQPNHNSTSCIPAPSGSFVDTTGATSSNLCPVGQYQPLVGQSLCTPAPAGSFVNAAGSTSSTLCLSGSYQPLIGQISCLLADPGFYVGSSGATQ
ncbi:MAG: Ig-like domain repeat protein, partial [Patescibacteria group bacterium]|nr:Ig-like domain repeat protein [Patescibacteria group bacterium]